MTRSIGLAIETTGKNLGVTLFHLNTPPKKKPILSSLFVKAGPRQSDILIPEIEKSLKKYRLTISHLGFIVVDVGPGSFTGVRVGVSTARALAQGLNLPLMGISSLELMVQSLKAKEPHSLVVSVMAALSGELYNAVYKKTSGLQGSDIQCVSKPCWEKYEEFEKRLRKISTSMPVYVITDSLGENFLAWSKKFPRFQWLEKSFVPHPESLAYLAIHRIGKRLVQKKFPFEKVAPLYLQPSWAERRKQ